MDFNIFNNLTKIDDILKELKSISTNISASKRWLNTSETAIYLGYSKEHIPKLKNSYFIEGKHYYKKAGRVLFDKYELDIWITTPPLDKLNAKEMATRILKDLI